MAHHDVELPRHIARGAKGGSKFNTTVLQMASGREQRNINWSRVRGEWDIGYGLQNREDMEEVLHFFHARWGRAHSFNFYDWVDHSVGIQSVGVADGATTQFQMFKRYQNGPYYFDYEIKKIVPGSVLGVAVDNAGDGNFTTVNPLVWSVDETTGILEFDTAPSWSSEVQVLGFEFYRPVRFDTDLIETSIDFYENFTFPQIPLVEVKL